MTKKWLTGVEMIDWLRNYWWFTKKKWTKKWLNGKEMIDWLRNDWLAKKWLTD